MLKWALALLLVAVSASSTTPAFAQTSAGDGANYAACLYGTYGCNPSRLTDSQQGEVQQAALQRNYRACLYGSYGCNPSLLDVEQRFASDQAAHQRAIASATVAPILPTA